MRRGGGSDNKVACRSGGSARRNDGIQSALAHAERETAQSGMAMAIDRERLI
jgi:hypothetical protein